MAPGNVPSEFASTHTSADDRHLGRHRRHPDHGTADVDSVVGCGDHPGAWIGVRSVPSTFPPPEPVVDLGIVPRIAASISIVVAAGAMLLGTAASVAAQSAPPTISEDSLVVESRDALSDELSVRGGGFAPDSEISLVLVGSRRTATSAANKLLPLDLGTVTTDDTGRFETTVEVSDVPPDWYVLQARGTNPDGSREVLARDVRIGASDENDESLLDAFRWVGYSLLLLGLLVVSVVGARKLAERRSVSSGP